MVECRVQSAGLPAQRCQRHTSSDCESGRLRRAHRTSGVESPSIARCRWGTRAREPRVCVCWIVQGAAVLVYFHIFYFHCMQSGADCRAACM